MLSKNSIEKLPKKLSYIKRRSRQKISHVFEDIGRLIEYGSKPQSIVNKKEVRILGLRRSGNHPIINWIGKQIQGQAVFMNHVRPLENPYRAQYESQLIFGNNLSQQDWKYRDTDWWKQEKVGKFSFKDCLIYSYEDQELDKIAHPSFERKHDLYLGKSEERYDVIVMRDPFNLFASRLKHKPRDNRSYFSMLEVYSRRYSLPELWICYAKECLGETNFLKNKKIFINYNQWFLDSNYRREIANQLKIDFSDNGLNDIPPQPSSFDGASYAGKANKMDVLNRWKLFIDNDLYRELLQTKGLLDYSINLFGQIPGTEVLFN